MQELFYALSEFLDDAMNDHIGLIILSVFCAGGLFAYVREALRLGRLISSGTVAKATVVGKEKIDTGSESVTHFLVKYEFPDYRGESTVHEQDLNDGRFFQRVSVGDRIDIIYQRDSAHGNSYPLSQVRADLKIARLICAGLVVFWAVMGAYLL